jgi:Flp pilus assembly protein CpaB
VGLLGASAACAGLAASLVNGYANDVRSQIGPLAPVVVAGKDIPHGRLFTAGNVPTLLTVRRVPVRFVPPAALSSPLDAIGLRTAIEVERGGYMERGDLAAPGAPRARIATAPSARMVEVPVAGSAALADLLRPGSRVDVLVTSDRAGGGGRTYLALQRVAVVGLRTGAQVGGADRGGASAADGVATLRVSLRQAVVLTAASNFAREVRLVPRPARDERLLGPTAISAGELRP